MEIEIDRKTKLKAIKALSKKVRHKNSQRKYTDPPKGDKSSAGYSTYVTRPIRDVVKWMDAVEELLDDLILGGIPEDHPASHY